MISMGGAIKKAHRMRVSNGQSCLSIAPPIEISATTLSISNIEIIATQHLQYFPSMVSYSCTFKL